MNKIETTLVVMAAGMGSRFGGLKQITPVGEKGQVILDYSIYDAMKAGFDKVVFIIKKEIEADFKEGIGNRIAKKIPVSYVYQQLDSLLPEGVSVPEGRQKPWGTGHAVLCAKDVVDTPFGIINADDYYGADSFQKLHDHLISSSDPCMVGFLLDNTLTENGTVSRGVCQVEDGLLKEITEHTALDRSSGFAPDTIVSMNMWGFTPSVFKTMEEGFADFFRHLENPEKQEYFLPSVVDHMIHAEQIPLSVLKTEEKWYGVTYREDLPPVQEAIKKMTDNGQYDGL